MNQPLQNESILTFERTIVFEKYNDLDRFFKICIRVLSGEIDPNFAIVNSALDGVYRPGTKNNLSILNHCKDKIGIYIFHTGGVPEYIGKGGTGRNFRKGKDLKYRISQEFSPYGRPQNTLSKNIIDYHRALGQELNGIQSLEVIKSLSLLVLVVGDRMAGNNLNRDAIAKTEALETMLLYLFKTRFNK